MQGSFLVHNFTVNASPQSTPTPPDALLEIGRDLIRKAVESKGWSTVTHKGGIEVSDDTVFSLSELEDFESTDLGFLFVVCSRDISASTDGRKDPLAEPSSRTHKRSSSKSETLPTTRRRVDISSLHTIIPQPHFHRAPAANPIPTDARITPYRKVIPRPISPHTQSTVRDYLRTPYAQCAWVVPVRGVLPWEECSSAVVLGQPNRNETLAVDLPQPVNETCQQIVWTHASLPDFWSFLLAVRDANTLGPIALSFHSSSANRINSHSHAVASDVSINCQAAGPAGTVNNGSVTNDVCRVPLLAVDHIKVYHEAACTMLIRNVLHAWGYPQAASDQVDSGTKHKIRILKGAKLVLVDERSKGVLIC